MLPISCPVSSWADAALPATACCPMPALRLAHTSGSPIPASAAARIVDTRLYGLSTIADLCYRPSMRCHWVAAF
ncbi:MAG: hypothetical protein INR71_00600 [Terriglobus roseus]|nr:hypothetical protein [Terriglobus roseus]